jgi:hypothetical protein
LKAFALLGYHAAWLVVGYRRFVTTQRPLFFLDGLIPKEGTEKPVTTYTAYDPGTAKAVISPSETSLPLFALEV